MDFEPSPAELELVHAVRAAAADLFAGTHGVNPDAEASAVVTRCEALGLFSGSTVGFTLALCELSYVSLPVAERVAARHAGVTQGAMARLVTAALAVGLARRALDAALSAVRSGSEKPRQKVQFALSDMATELDASAVAVAHAAFTRDAGRSFEVEAATAVLLATRTATRCLHTALGLVDDAGRPALEQAYLAARALEAAHGGEVDAENLIASHMLEEI